MMGGARCAVPVCPTEYGDDGVGFFSYWMGQANPPPFEKKINFSEFGSIHPYRGGPARELFRHSHGGYTTQSIPNTASA